jgi:hypothetical protein
MIEEHDMSTPETDVAREAPLFRPSLGADGEPCSVCGAPLAFDQRYCLNCGTRRADARLPFLDLLPQEPEAAAAAPSAEPPRRAGGGPLALIVAGTAVAAVLGLGLVGGALLAGADDPPATKAPVVNITNTPTGAGGGATPATPTSFTSDWPAGQEGWTVQLQTLPKDSSDPAAVQAAKDQAAGGGATDVGALDSDEFASLDPGSYVVYAGVYDSRADARNALADLSGSYPDAEVVEVSAGGGGGGGGEPAKADPDAEKQSDEELQQKEELSPEEAQKEIQKAPAKVESEGEAPEKDNKAPGGGSDATELE